jgi:hypothetical protein
VTIPPHHLAYDIGSQEEHILGFGDQDAVRKILLIPPLFDEMNRVRQMLVNAMRDLEQRGVASFLPDLPGTNESLALMPEQDLDSWRIAMTMAAEQTGATHIAAIRGGTLIDDAMPDLPHWRLAPVNGTSLIKTMMRARIASDKEAGLTTSTDDLMAEARISRVALSGHLLNLKMVEQLTAAEPADLAGVRTVTLGDGPDMITGSALWLRAEPQEDTAMSAAIAADLDRWSASCGG